MESGPPTKRTRLDEQSEPTETEGESAASVLWTPVADPLPQSSATLHQSGVQDTTLSLRANIQGYPYQGDGSSFSSSAYQAYSSTSMPYHHHPLMQRLTIPGEGTGDSTMPQGTVSICNLSMPLQPVFTSPPPAWTVGRAEQLSSQYNNQNFVLHGLREGTSDGNAIVSVRNLSMPLQPVVFTSQWGGPEQQPNRGLITTTPALSTSYYDNKSSVIQGCGASSQATTEISMTAHQALTPSISVAGRAGFHDPPTNYQAQTSGKYTTEYQTIRKCVPRLRTAFKHRLTELSSYLLSKGLISSDQDGELRNQMHSESDRAAKLVDFVLNKVELNSSCYTTFIECLEEDQENSQEILKQLRGVYASGQTSTVVGGSSNITKLNEYLLSNFYDSEVTSADKFPYLPNKKFITLAIIEKEGINQTTADIFTKGTLHGHADEIRKKKTPIGLEAVLEPPPGKKTVKCVFVEGAPGIGKSTFALELCRRQKQIESMKKYSLVILLRLREKEIQNIQNTSMVFESICRHDPNLQQCVSEEVTASGGENVLFILDGFDELPTHFRNYSFFTKLIRGTHLPACTVLVTSRPSASADLLNCIKGYKHIEVIGFTKEKIEQYAESMLNDQPAMLKDFLKYVSGNLPIRGMMYVPLNSAIVLQIYKMNWMTTGKHIPRTMTELYTELCLTLLRKNLEEKSHSLANQVNCDTALQELPECIRDKIVLLGELAFEGALKQEITFAKLPSGCDDLGFMNVSTGLYLGRKSYSFLHLTLQEFLAAYYFSQLPPNEQRLKFSQLQIEDKNAHGSYLDVMWTFVAGLTGFKHIGWKLVATNMKKQTDVCIARYLYEVQNVEELKVACRLFHDLIPYRLLDCYLAGYCIAVSGRGWNFYNRNGYSINGDEAVEMLSYGFKSATDIDPYGSISSLNLPSNGCTEVAIKHLSNLMLFEKLRILNLYGNCLDKSAYDQLSHLVPHMVNLQFLSLRNNYGGDGAMVELLPKLTQLQTLNITNTTLGLSDVQALSELLKSTECLMELKIGDPYISEENISLMVEVLLSPSSLGGVLLESLKWTTKNVASFALLENNENIIVLNFAVFHEEFEREDGTSSLELNPVIPVVAKALHKNETLVHLGVPHCAKPHIQRFDIKHESVVALSEMLKVNKTLKHLDVFTPLTCKDVQVLASALQDNCTLEKLHLWNERITILDPDIHDEDDDEDNIIVKL